MRFSVFNPFSNFYMPSSNSLHPQLLRSLVSFWLEGCPTECLQQPMDMALIKKWFMPNDNFDHTCRTHYRQPLEEAMRLDDQAVLDLATQGTPDTALGMILLLDQISRNTYRGTEAQKAYTVCDPKAQRLSRTIISEPYNMDRSPQFGNYLRRQWLYIPLMHSEHLEDHQLFRQKAEYWLGQEGAQQHEEEAKSIQKSLEFLEAHSKVLEKYGRYYSRNEAMGRKSTLEEKEALRHGPGWGPPPDKQ